MAVEAQAGAPAAPLRRKRARVDLTTPGLLGLPVGWLLVFFVVPIGIVAAYSFDALSINPGPHPLTLTAWHDFLHSAGYLRLFWRSVRLSLIVSAIIVALAYPLAYYLALSGTKRKYVLLLLLIAPFLTSYLLRVLAWKILLGDEGPINTFLFWVHVRAPDHPLTLLDTRFAVMLVLGYIWLPFVALPIFVSLESLDRRLLEAATDLGASRLQAFRRVTLPLSAPGVFAAFLFVFIPTLGEFVTPSLVGGASGYLYGNQINDLFHGGFPDWETGSVLAIFLLGVVAILTVVFARFLQPRQVTSGWWTSRSHATAPACSGRSSLSSSRSSTRRSSSC
jgi:spermidine/putrescine transport system permease protein